MKTAIARVIVFAAVCGFVVAGCSSEPSVDDAAADAAPADSGPSDGDIVEDGPEVGDADAADAPEACPGVEPCGEGQRMVDCRCVSNMDRRCVDDGDCRPTETCESFDEHRVCIYEAAGVQKCPGSAGCDGGGDGELLAGAASRVVTPQGFETPTAAGVDEANYLDFGVGSVDDEVWNDCGYDGLCPGDDGYDGPDEGEADGKMQAMWLAGFSNGRPAQYCPDDKIGCDAPDCCVSKYAHDDLMVQVAALRQDDVTVVFAAVDTIGWFHTDIEEVRRRVAEQVDVDLLIMAGTHNHEAPDTAGQWGPGSPAPSESGRNPRFIEGIYAQSTEAIVEAVESLQPARAEAAVLDVGVEGLAISDSRPPYIFNDDVPVVRLRAADTDESIATLLSFGQHPEVLWSNNPYITSDYPHFVRKYIGEGLEATADKPALDGLGGVTVFFAGTVGGLINPGRGGAKDYAGEEPEERHSYEAADAVGQSLAGHVLGAVDRGELEQVDTPQLRFARKEFLSPIRNTVFQLAAYALGVLERDIYNATPLGGTDYAPDVPKVLTEVAVVQLGSVSFFTAPGEVFPETLVGGFPGKPTVRSPVVGDVEQRRVAAECDEQGLPTDDPGADHPCIVSADQTNPPDWTAAPEPPYGYQWVGAEHPFFIGLGMDFLGYMVPEYDFETSGYFNAAPGSHYEETNGIGPDLIGDWRAALDEAIEAL